jgi:hypothetical protein
MKDLYDQHLAEVHEAQSKMDRAIINAVEEFQNTVYASRSKLHEESLRRFAQVLGVPEQSKPQGQDEKSPVDMQKLAEALDPPP